MVTVCLFIFNFDREVGNKQPSLTLLLVLFLLYS